MLNPPVKPSLGAIYKHCVLSLRIIKLVQSLSNQKDVAQVPQFPRSGCSNIFGIKVPDIHVLRYSGGEGGGTR